MLLLIWTWGEGKPCKSWKTLWPLTGKLNSWTHYTDDIFRFNLVIFIWKMASYISFIFIILLQISLSQDSYFRSCIFINLIVRNELIASYLFLFFIFYSSWVSRIYWACSMLVIKKWKFVASWCLFLQISLRDFKQSDSRKAVS